MNRQKTAKPTDGDSSLEKIFGADTMSHFPKALAQEAEGFLATGGRPYSGEDVRNPEILSAALAGLKKIGDYFIVSRPYPEEIESIVRKMPEGWSFSHDEGILSLGHSAVATANRVLGLLPTFEATLETDLVLEIYRIAK